MKQKSYQLITQSKQKLQAQFERIDNVALCNQQKVLNAFYEYGIELRHFYGTSGYGYDDVGRDALNKVFAKVFGTEDAIVTPRFTCGTHAISTTLFSLLKSGDSALSISGKVYDSLHGVIKGEGSLEEFGISFDCVDLIDGQFDFETIKYVLASRKIQMVYIQRSRGYDDRNALSIEQIEKACSFVKTISPDTFIMVDNCYGEFTAEKEPIEVGADVCVGSLIKNLGGGIAPTGGYVCGTQKLVNLVWRRFSTPTLLGEVGSFELGYRLFYQGLFLAPHTVAQALKTIYLFAQCLTDAGYDVTPSPDQIYGDIVLSVKLQDRVKLIDFCQAIQSQSPVDARAVPTPWAMPGYSDEVIMAAGCFVQGSSIELSCDGPMRPPFIAYLQGGVTFEHGIIACGAVLDRLI